MPTLREFFTTEAADVLSQLTRLVQKLDAGSTDHASLHKQSRTLRGSAQMAREDRVYRAALGLESAARSVVNGALTWSEDVSARVRRSIEDIEALVKGEEADDAADDRVRRSLERWRAAGVEIPEEDAAARQAQVSEASRQFRQFAAHEVAGIIAEMEISLETLASDPRNRDPLKAILRRERALLGAARLNEIGIVAEALRATEDMTRIIAKLNVPVKEEWLAVFRAARDILKAALEPLQRGEVPTATPASSKLRVLRQELMERYGEGDAANATTSPQPPVAASAMTASHAAPAAANTAAAADADGVVPIEHLQLKGAAALRRALELKAQFDQIAAANPAYRESIDELFDLIKLGLS